MQTKKNGLTLNMQSDGSYLCQDLKDLPQAFSRLYSSEQVQGMIDEHLAFMRDLYDLDVEDDSPEAKLSEDERRAKVVEIFDSVVSQIKDQELSDFHRIMFWFGDWWFLAPTFKRLLSLPRRKANQLYERLHEKLKEMLLDLLPASVKAEVGDLELVSVVQNNGHFAMMFIDQDEGIRRIVTDSQLFELHGVYGYVYLDVTLDGRPVARCVCRRGGGRAFFDGVRLMSHEQFETCAPKTVMVEGGYMVNSTDCTIINGFLFDLIDREDKVAQTTGAWCMMGRYLLDFTSNEHADSFERADQNAKQLKIEGERFFLGERELLPNGFFAPSRVTLLDNGFALYDFSDFHEIERLRYQKVMVVDDAQEWVDQVQAEFGAELSELEICLTTDMEAARDRVLALQPELLMLDMHLSADERFEGLWIANQLIASEFKGRILLTSGYGPDKLRAMALLIKGKVGTPGKDLAKIRRFLVGKE